MRIFKRTALAVVIVLILVSIAGFLILPVALKPVLTKKLSETLRRPTTIDKISINPFALSVTVKGFSIADSGNTNPLLSFDELYVNADAISSIFRRAIILEEIRLERPYIGITRKADGSYNFSDLIPVQESKPKPDKKEKPFLFSLNNIQINNGSIDFADEPNKTRHTVRELHLSVPFISNIEYYLKNYVEPKFSAKTNNHLFQITGKTQPFLDSHATSFDVNITDLDIPFYLAYVPLNLNFKLKSASLDTKMKIDFIMRKDQSPTLKMSGNVTLRKIVLDDLQDNKIVRLPSISINLASALPLESDIHLADITILSPELVIRRNKKGEINLQNLVGQDKKLEQSAATKPSEQASPDKTDKNKKPLNLRLDSIILDKADITFIDATPAQPVKINIAPLQLKATNLSTVKGAPAGHIDLTCTLDKKGTVSVKGPVSIEPLDANLALDLKNIGIRTFQSYFTDKVKIDVTRGAVSTSGNLSLAMDKKNDPVIKYAGKISVSNLATIDKAQSNDFLKWKELSFDQIQTGYNPFFLNIKTISLSDFYARIIINAGATTNIQDILSDDNKKELQQKNVPAESVKKKAEEAKPKTAEKPADIKIGKIVFKGGNVDFTDRNIKPNYSANMLNLTGSVTGLSSQDVSRADVTLKGNLGYGSPIDIAGKINPLAKDLFADIKISFKDIEMSPVTPYTNRFLGYPITKGKLTFDVAYLVDKRKLVAKNKVTIDQLTFGDKVESPDAIKAPVTLAVSLLTDRNGQINLDIPISGSLDDPQFKVWPIIWQVLVNLITKAVTSPFSLLASLTGGGEELSFIEFDYGSTTVTDDNRKKITILGKALYDRPNLKLDIEGSIDPENDKAGLKKAELIRRIKAQKRREMLAKGGSETEIDLIQLSAQEYDKYLKQAYNAGDFTKPRNALGILKELPGPEMEKLILASIAVTDSDLRQLAAKRAQNVKELILEPDNVNAGRIFIVEPKTLIPEKKDKVKDSRVNFKLK